MKLLTLDQPSIHDEWANKMSLESPDKVPYECAIRSRMNFSKAVIKNNALDCHFKERTLQKGQYILSQRLVSISITNGK